MLYPADDRQHGTCTTHRPRASKPERFIHTFPCIYRSKSHPGSLALQCCQQQWLEQQDLSVQAKSTQLLSTHHEQKSMLGDSHPVAIRSLFHDGLVVVTDVVPHDILDRLNNKMIDDAQELYARKGNSPFNYNPNNLQQDPPPTKKYFDSQIFLSA